MEKPEKRRISVISSFLTPRYILGMILIIASFLSAFVISEASDKTITVWGSAVDLAPGEVITESDISLVRVRLPENAAQYLDGAAQIVGATVLRSIGAAELIPSFAITTEVDTSLVQVPISAPVDLVPIELSSGAVVDLYGIPNGKNQVLDRKETRTQLIISDVTVDSINNAARELGGRIGITLLIPKSEVLRVVSTLGDYELLVAKRMIHI